MSVAMNAARVVQGHSPVILAMPHVGTEVPDDVVHKLNEEGRTLRDTDWHVDKLYNGLLPDATIVRAVFHRYVIDLNRDPKQVSLYPGQNTTELVPRANFDNEPIWKKGAEPDAAEIDRRLAAFHAPYHQALAAEIARVKREHGMVLLYDCHSIRSVVPFLFEGTLPDFNIGTDNGKTCAPEFERAAVDVCKEAAARYSYVLNGRFRGGWTTRHYGQPATGVHAIQMELAQRNYLASEDAPFFYDGAKAEGLRAYLQNVLAGMKRVALSLRG
jgi:N-formylglutamate deformylase